MADKSEPSIESRVIESVIALREERGWTQSELARRMAEFGWPKYTQMTVSRTEKGERPVRLNEAEALAEVFGVEMYALWLPRSVREYEVASKRAESLSEELNSLIGKYLAAQEELAYRADHAELAEDEISYVAAQLVLTPERLVEQVKLERKQNKEAVVARIGRPLAEREVAAEDAFWSSPDRKLHDLFEALNGIDPEAS
ncbi:hypothetical protein GCM10009596_23580 [Arthrobacter rhombi]|uniref:helix-turn-helix domain-containing protein n=1 Tax=Arthrobacter rhombi TaxID=71253 RepID=UPI0031E45664